VLYKLMIADIVECADATLCVYNTTCVNTVGSFHCSCKEHYEVVDQTNPVMPKCERNNNYQSRL